MSTWKKAFALTLLSAIPITGYSNCPGPETWALTTGGNWNVGANWSPNTCVPGSGAVTNTDSATFSNTVALPSTISLSGVSITPGLGELIFNNQASLTIFADPEFLQFNGATSLLEVLAGSHQLNTAVRVNNTVLNVTVSNLSSLLTLNGDILEAAGSTSSMNFDGLGQLLNNSASRIIINGSFTMASGTVQNTNAVMGVVNTSLINPGLDLLINGGTCITSNTGAINLSVGARTSAGRDIALNNGAMILSNTNDITTAGTGSNVRCIRNFTVNNGIVTATNTGAVDGSSTGCFLDGPTTIINSGTLTFLNSGPITDQSFGTFFSANNITINDGSILNSNTGSVANNISTGCLISAQVNLIMNGGMLTNTNTGVITSQGIGSLIEAGTAFALNGGVFINNDTVWTPELNIASAGTLAGSGLFQNVNRVATIHIVNAGTVIPGGPSLGGAPGVMTVQGSYSQSSSGTLGINLLNSSAFSQLIVTGIGTAQLNGNLAVAVTPGAAIRPGETFAIVQATNGVTGTFSQLINFNISNLAPQVQYFPTFVLLSFTPAASSYPNYFETLFASNNHINLRLERQMAQLRDRFHEKTQKIVSAKKSKNVREEEPALERAMTIRNELDLALKIDQPLSLIQNRSTQEKQEQLRRTISVPRQEYPWNFYLGPTSNIGEVLTKKNSLGFNYWSAGALAGFDYAFSQVGIGLLVNYDHIRGTGDHHWGQFDVNHVHANLYATYAPRSMPQLAVNAILGGGYDGYGVRRNAGTTAFPAVAKGSPQGSEFDALLGLEYAFVRSKFEAMPHDLQVVPLLSFQYTYLHAGKYREHGAGLFDLKFNHQTAESFRSTLGARLNYTWEWKDVVFTPELELAWQREFLDHSRSVGFAPIDFAVPTTNLNMASSGRNVALAGVDFLVTLFDKYGIEASYDFEWNSLYHDHFFYVGCNFKF